MTDKSFNEWLFADLDEIIDCDFDKTEEAKENRMTDKEIIKDCPICGGKIEVVYIGGGWFWRHKINPPYPTCPITHSRKYATRKAAVEAINKRADNDLINRQQAEIERLQTVIFKKEDTMQMIVKQHSVELQNATADFERLKKLFEEEEKKYTLCAKKIYKEAVKDFEDKFKSVAGIYQKDTYVIGVDEFQALIKEMAGDAVE